MRLWPAHQFLQDARTTGLPAESSRAALDAAHRVQEKGLPAVLTLNHLAYQTGVPYRFIRRIVTREDTAAYRTFYIRKRNGARRRIFVPSPNLQRVQKWIARHILNRIPCHPRAYAYAPGRGVAPCAEQHCLARWIIKWDIKDFFPSISESDVYRVFVGFGYGSLVSFEMARLCTSIDDSAFCHPARRQLAAIPAYSSSIVGFLPQGAPSSPMLSNHVASRLDESLSEVAREERLIYTRYADDICLSSAAQSIPRWSISQTKEVVDLVIRECGFVPNEAKFRVLRPGSRRAILGLLVHGAKPALLRRFKSRLRRHVYFLQTRGAVAHVAAIRFRSITAFRSHLEGLISHAASVDAVFGTRIVSEYTKVVWPS
jgi:RNA-directed DNA polymerase